MLGVSGKYRLDQRLGGGGMAEVFLGSAMGAEGFSRPVAIKRVLPAFSDNVPFSQMFVAEAQISAQLVHPNIVSVLDFDRDADNRLFLVMELIDGKDLDALLETGPLPLPVVIYVIGEVLRGLGYAHDLPVGTSVRGVVHRDISPHNVLLSWAGAVKVSDFGIAKARSASEATASVFIKGKPAYMSPEQARTEPLDGRSDLFAVGIMLWEMLVGRRLFVAADTRATLSAVLFGQIPRPRALRNTVPKDLERVVMKLLERDLPARYATAEAALADLVACSDAPTAGRELLTATLAQRFSTARVRQSQLKKPTPRDPVPAPRVLPATPAAPRDVPAAPNGAVSPLAPTSIAPLPDPNAAAASPGTRTGVPPRLGPHAITARGRPAFQHAPTHAEPPDPTTEAETLVQAPSHPVSMPSLGAIRNAETRTIDRSDLPAGMPAIDAPAAGDAPTSPAPDAPRSRRWMIWAIVLGLLTAVSGIATFRIVSNTDAPTSAPTPTKFGTLHVPDPASLAVLVDGVLVGRSPATFHVPVGTRTVTLEDRGGSATFTKTVPITIVENQTTTVNR